MIVLRLIKAAVNALIGAGAKVNAKNKEGETPLMDAIQSKNELLILDLINAGADINILSKYNGNILHLAAENNLSLVIDKLKEDPKKFKALLNAKDQIGYTPLIAAIISGHESIAIDLIKAGADINIHSPLYKRNILHLAAGKNLTELISFLHKQDPKKFSEMLKATDSEAKTPLETTHLNGKPTITTLLLQLGANIDYEIFTEEMFRETLGTVDALRLTYLNKMVPNFINECFNQNDLKRLAECMEVLYLRQPNADPLLRDRNALSLFIAENYEKIKDIYFQNHSEKLKAAVEELQKMNKDFNIDRFMKFMKRMLTDHIANLLRERTEYQLHKSFAEGAGYEEPKEEPKMASASVHREIAEIMDEYVSGLEETQPSELNSPIERRLLPDDNLRDLEKLLKEERRKVFVRQFLPTVKMKESNPLTPIYEASKSRAATSKPEQPKPESPKPDTKDNKDGPKPP